MTKVDAAETVQPVAWRSKAERILANYDKVSENKKDGGPEINLVNMANSGDLALQLLRSMLASPPDDIRGQWWFKELEQFWGDGDYPVTLDTRRAVRTALSALVASPLMQVKALDVTQTAEAVARAVCAGPDVAAGAKIIEQALSSLVASPSREEVQITDAMVEREALENALRNFTDGRNIAYVDALSEARRVLGDLS